MGDRGDISRIQGQIHAGESVGSPINLLDFEPSFPDQLSSTARSEEPDIVLDETFSKIKKPRLIINREYCLEGSAVEHFSQEPPVAGHHLPIFWLAILTALQEA